MTVELFFTHGLNLGGIFMHELLRVEDPETRRRLFTLTAKYNRGDPPLSFDYADMSTDALRGPPVVAMAFAGIVVCIPNIITCNVTDYVPAATCTEEVEWDCEEVRRS